MTDDKLSAHIDHIGLGEYADIWYGHEDFTLGRPYAWLLTIRSGVIPPGKGYIWNKAIEVEKEVMLAISQSKSFDGDLFKVFLSKPLYFDIFSSLMACLS